MQSSPAAMRERGCNPRQRDGSGFGETKRFWRGEDAILASDAEMFFTPQQGEDTILASGDQGI